MAREVVVVGAGWAGLAAAVEAVRGGARVTLFEMAPAPGGRARDVVSHGAVLDNGAHICIGAYVETLRLLGIVGVDVRAAFLREPLRLVDADGAGLRMRGGPALAAFVLAVLGRRGWSWGERVALLRVAARWRRDGFRCAPERTVADLSAELPPRVRHEFIEPLCVAALNTPLAEASGTVFLRVLHDALGAGPGAADLLLPSAGWAKSCRRPRWSGSSRRVPRFASPIASNGSSATLPVGVSTAWPPIASSSRRARSKRHACSSRTPARGPRAPRTCATSLS